MLLGEGSKKIGEPCWSHVQCQRSQKNSYCDFPVCKCERPFENIDGLCTRDYWKALGLQNWQLLMIALFIILFCLAVFFGCIYYLFRKIVRKYRRTRPLGEPLPSESFKGLGSKRNSLTGEAAAAEIKLKEKQRDALRTPQPVEWKRTQLMQKLDVLKEQEEEADDEEGEEEEEDEEEESSYTSEAGETDEGTIPATTIRPLTKFILPLHYAHKGTGPGRRGVDLMRRSSSAGSWSVSSWEVEPLEAGLMDWCPTRKQFRRPSRNGEPNKTLRPLLLHGAASDSEDEI